MKTDIPGYLPYSQDLSDGTESQAGQKRKKKQLDISKSKYCSEIHLLYKYYTLRKLSNAT